MNAVTPGIRAAIAAGRHIQTKDGVGLEPLIRAIEENNRAVDGRLKSIEGTKATADELSARMLEVEQMLVRRPGSGPTVPQTWGQQVAEASELKAFAENTSRPGRVRFEMKTTITGASDSAGPLVDPTRDTVVMKPRRQLHVRDLLPKVRISTNSVEYPKQTTRTNNAGTVAEGTTKPESAYAFELKTTAAQVIAHWVPQSRQILEDAPQLADLIDTELRYGLALKEDEQLLTGSGTGANLLGLIPQAMAYSAPITITSPDMLDTVALAILQTSLADLPADGIVIHPSDWMRMRLLKDADGKYVLGPPGANVQPTLFGLPVVATTSMTIDKFLVGNFQAAATLYDRWTPRVEIATEHADFFVRNMVAVLVEQRLALAVKQPEALVYGDFGNVA